MSRSCDSVCVIPRSRAVTLVIWPASPETKMFEGYGVEAPTPAGVAILPGLQKVLSVTTVLLSIR